ncbi:signal peptide containing [Cryptosporidium sp. chipmunk genotype I]|uniref:signal peptide containing n=1 Tax=Cryptosporidium sp. chipmunk genotype I TaxID=1280935 RepID=UPI00351A223A|nr:signal peptide containing [Cryptosporidium sp. chipmunk genotype I]
MIPEYTKVHILILVILYFSLFNFNLRSFNPYFTQSFLQANTKKFFPPKGSFNYMLPGGTYIPSGQSTVRRPRSSSLKHKHLETSTHNRRSNSATGSSNYDDISTSNPVPFPLPPPDYDDDPSQSTVDRIRRSSESSTQLVVAPPELLLPEPDYHDEDLEEKTKESNKSRNTIRRTLSRKSGFGISNLLANQAVSVARRSFSKGDSQKETVEEKVARRRSRSLSREIFLYVDDTQFSNQVLSLEIPQNLREECKDVFAQLLSLIQKINSEVRELNVIKEYIRNCNCETNNCARCQDHFSLYNFHKAKYLENKSSMESKTEFLFDHCFSGSLNKYESSYYSRYFQELFSALYDQIIKKNRLYTRNLLLKCDIVTITDKIIEKQTKCRSCKKKREVCKEHSNLLQQLREIESAKTKNIADISLIMEDVLLKIGNLPTRMVRDLYRLEEEDEKFLTSQIIVKECMKKLSIKSTDMSALNKIFHKNKSSSKKSLRKKPSLGSTATKPSSFRPGFVGNTQTSSARKTQKTAQVSSTSSLSTSSRRPSSRPYEGASGTTTQRASQRLSTRAKSISRRTPSGASRRTPSSVGIKDSYHSSQSPHPSLLTQHMKTSPYGPFTGPESGAIPKTKWNGEGHVNTTSYFSGATAKKSKGHKKDSKASKNKRLPS